MKKESFEQRQIGSRWDVWNHPYPTNLTWGNGGGAGWTVWLTGGLTSSLLPISGWKLIGRVVLTSHK